MQKGHIAFRMITQNLRAINLGLYTGIDTQSCFSSGQRYVDFWATILIFRVIDGKNVKITFGTITPKAVTTSNLKLGTYTHLKSSKRPFEFAVASLIFTHWLWFLSEAMGHHMPTLQWSCLACRNVPSSCVFLLILAWILVILNVPPLIFVSICGESTP